MNKVSIIIPVYNVELYLSECLESVLRQTYEYLEVILIDDGSTDSSGRICDEYAAKDNRTVVVHQKNAGAANAKNAGLDLSTGDYIAFVDSDDIVDEKWIETMLMHLTKEDADLVECDFDSFTKTKMTHPVKRGTGLQLFSPNAYMEQYLDYWTNGLFCLKVFHRELTNGIRFRSERRCIDDEFYTYKVVSNAKKIVRIEDTLYHYRQRRSSAVRSEKNQRQITKDAMELRPERYLWIKAKYPELRKKYLLSDMDYIVYLTQNGLFDEEAKQIYRKVARFYIKESVPFIADKRVLMLCWSLLQGRIRGNTTMGNGNTPNDDYYE